MRPKRLRGVPEDRKQTNSTDPESRIMGPPKRGSVHGDDGQIAEDEGAGLIAVARVTQSAANVGELVPTTGRGPDQNRPAALSLATQGAGS